MKTFKIILAITALVFASSSHAASSLTENFDDVGALAGWQLINHSSPAGLSWFQGNDGIFGAHAGAANAYIGANYLSASQGIGYIDNWLITPELTLSGPTLVSFYTRGAGTPGFSDMLELRFSSGAGSAIAGFTHTLLTVGGSGPYPDLWTLNQATLDAVGSGRFAFRYVGNASASDYIGIDSVLISAVPEASTWAMLLAGLAALGWLRRQHLAGGALLAVGAVILSPCAIAIEAPSGQQGMVTVRDAETGQLRAPTPVEAQALLRQPGAAPQRSGPAPQAVIRADGSRQVKLDGGKQVFSVMTRDTNGNNTLHCVTGDSAADALQQNREHRHGHH
ncbi:choice-of-anchor J domain-containing protein [Janthinobacterium agaricidamnosum]|uniref:PEP-CTERM putative exosortase interaction domain protein n=1 Tax=Janthinobacterium agaricidamnosum NBRC 102515 = DSM 9628 TaxID=1349767 RepID=W0VC24_9BURK|nr:choice-of-anchor J domain-containing protein [Janthinobacterium agaricidamnosum]CDG84857.1 PEP-CTERM putative exosortase interaction domain protein [Janthinobacterium agaricidamnosum NBRC 102515 = DSM 9628]